jgi:uncharacterized membrane protein
VSFANPLPWWAFLLILFAAAIVAWFAYSARNLSPGRRAALVGLRFVTLLVLVVFVMRPVARSADLDARDAVVPVLVDASRSMGLEDADAGRATARRIDRARQLLTERLLPVIGARFQVEVLAFGESVAPATPAQLSAIARRSDLEAALTNIRDRYHGRAIAGIVLLSDGGDTSGGAEHAAESSPPIFALGVGSAAALKDREVLSVTAAETVLDDSRVDLAVSAVSHGFGTSPIELRLLENGKMIDARRVTPASDGAPVREVFQVSPGRGAPAVYTVMTPAMPGEIAPENNARSVLVQPPARPRRVLLVEGAPGFEHSFLKRAWSTDQGLEIDSVVKKGRNEQGADTYYIQAARSRSDALTSGYPPTRDGLFAYDAVVLANVEGHQFTRAQLEATRAFVSQRGGGLLVLGARSFMRQGLGDTALEEVLPLDLADRGGPALTAGEGPSDVLPASNAKGTNRVALTAAGEAHPVMQLAPSPAESRKRWDAVPALASIATLGGPRPGASVLASTAGAGGTQRALVAVQRFGEGRAMVFSGEASWRWKMLLPATDRIYETFWKQAIRWLALPAGEPVAVNVTPGAAPDDTLPVRVIVRNAAFEALPNATVDVRITSPDGKVSSVRASPEPGAGAGGRYVATFRPEQAGVFKISVEARQGSTVMATAGTASTSALVGGADLEMTDPRVNVQLLERVAAASGGRLLTDADLASLPDILRSALPAATMAVRRDLWHNGWSFAMILTLLGAEWVLRRRWGLR